MKIRLLITLFILSIVLSCRAQRTSETEQGFSAAESIETPEAPVAAGEPQGAEDGALPEDVEADVYAEEAVVVNEEIAEALRVWTRAAKYPFREDSIEHIVYGNGRFVAAGYHRINFAYSDDGDEWTAVPDTIFGSSNAAAVAYGNGRFVAAAYGNKIACSDDGKTWTRVGSPGLGDNFVEGIAYGNGRFVAVGFSRDYTNGMIGYSTDGETWTRVEAGGLDIRLFNCVAYGNGMFIAGGSEGGAAYSTDGETWTAIRGPFEDLYVKIIACGNGRFVASCSEAMGYNQMTFYSDNGIDWTALSDGPFERSPVFNIVYANGIFIAVSHSARMSYSVDGKTWYAGSDGNGFIIDALAGRGDNLHGIAYGNGRFVIGGGNGTGGSSKIAWCAVPEIVTDIPMDLPEDDEEDGEFK
jgi:hypothetical protein